MKSIFVRTSLMVLSASITEINYIEIPTVELNFCTVTSYNKPPEVSFLFRLPDNFNIEKTQFFIGDFTAIIISGDMKLTMRMGKWC